jgi:hypothetical protein
MTIWIVAFASTYFQSKPRVGEVAAKLHGSTSATANLSNSTIPKLSQASVPHSGSVKATEGGQKSPFANTLAFIRWNNAYPERIPYMENYRPFFRELHYSMPNYTETTTLQKDGWTRFEETYQGVAETMQLILDTNEADMEDSINGLLFYHFDAWIDPMGFASMDFEQIWFPDAKDPMFECRTDPTPRDFDWYHAYAFADSVNATRKLATMNTKYKFDPEESCTGWTDVFYIPRKFFKDFIALSLVFDDHRVFLEVAIPTMIKIMKNSLRDPKAPFTPIISWIGDCYGNCCDTAQSMEEIDAHRCGHRLDLSNAELANGFFDGLKARKQFMGL